MNILSKVIFYFLILNLISPTINACTTAVISGNATSDGRPLLWKQRDTKDSQNKIVYFSDSKIPYIGLVNTIDTLNTEIWAGCNDYGFAIMNSASYNLKDLNSCSLDGKEGLLMKIALMVCKNLNDFENLLDTLKKPLGVEANFGVIDAYGGAAYYETNDNKYTKFDASQTKNGYIIRTNFSYTGRSNEGRGFIREQNASELFESKFSKSKLNKDYLLDTVCRSVYNSLTKIDLYKEYLNTTKKELYVNFSDNIVRYNTSSSIVIHGINNNIDKSNLCMWTILGWPLSSVAIPVFINKNIPKVLISEDNNNAYLCDKALYHKNKALAFNYGSGEKYINIAYICNKDNTGIYQKINVIDNEIRLKTKVFLNKDIISEESIIEFNNWLDKYVTEEFNKL